MDWNRINKELKCSLENVPFALEFDRDDFRYRPEVIQADRLAFSKYNFLATPDDITVKDIYITSTHDAEQIRLHVYQAKEFVSNKVILYFHGGGYVFGLPEQVDGLMFKLARDLKATIVSVAYRLAPKYPFPIPILDGYDALNWIIKEGYQTLDISADEIIVFGSSAGAHLGAAVAQMAVDNQIKNISHQFLVYPVITNKMDSDSMLEFTDAPLWNSTYALDAWRHFLGEDRLKKSLRYADLFNYDSFNLLPNTTVVVCELDPLRDEGIAYAQVLLRAGVQTELWVIPGAVHVFDLFDSPLKDAFYQFVLKSLK